MSEGYIITNLGDTVKGEIKDFGLNGNTKLCAFKANEAREFSEFKPGDIYSFRFNKKYYISKELNFEGHTDSLFIEFLVDGIVNLYYLQYNNLRYYLIEDEAGAQTLMKVNNNSLASNDEAVNAQVDRYRQIGTIKTIMKDYPPIYSEVDNVYFEDSRSMKNLIVSYHEGVCTEYDCIDYTKNKTKARMFFGLSFGLKIPALTFYSAFRYLEDADSRNSLSAYYSIDFSSTMPRTERFSLHAKLEFSKEKFEYANNGSILPLTLLSYNYAALFLNFNYAIGSGDITFLPYVGIGFNIYYNQDCTLENDPTPPSWFDPLILKNFMIVYNTGFSVDVPLIIDKGVHMRTSVDYRFSLRKPLKVKDKYNYYAYNALGFSIMLLKYF